MATKTNPKYIKVQGKVYIRVAEELPPQGKEEEYTKNAMQKTLPGAMSNLSALALKLKDNLPGMYEEGKGKKKNVDDAYIAIEGAIDMFMQKLRNALGITATQPKTSSVQNRLISRQLLRDLLDF